MSMVQIPDADPREERLPQWARYLIRDTRRAAEQRGNALAVVRAEADDSGGVLDPYGARIGLGSHPEVEFRAPDGEKFVVHFDAREGCLNVRVESTTASACRVRMGGASNVVRIEG